MSNLFTFMVVLFILGSEITIEDEKSEFFLKYFVPRSSYKITVKSTKVKIKVTNVFFETAKIVPLKLIEFICITKRFEDLSETITFILC